MRWVGRGRLWVAVSTADSVPLPSSPLPSDSSTGENDQPPVGQQGHSTELLLHKHSHDHDKLPQCLDGHPAISKMFSLHDLAGVQSHDAVPGRTESCHKTAPCTVPSRPHL